MCRRNSSDSESKCKQKNRNYSNFSTAKLARVCAKLEHMWDNGENNV